MSSRSPVVAPWSKLKSDLAPAERLLVDAFRRWLIGSQESRGQHWSILWKEFARALGPAGGKTGLAGFIGIMRQIGEHGRRPIRFHHVCCPCLGADELWLIGIVGACQRGDLEHARLLAEWVVHPDGVGDVLGAASNLACALAQHALVMPVRAGRPQQEEAERNTVR